MKETLLVIEDNTALRENTAELLELAGYNVLTAANGKEGLEVAQKDQPSLILCDIMMPELDGYGVLRAIENIPKLSGTPFIFFTSKSEKSDFRKGMDLGADDYLVKPFEGDDLLRVVSARLKKSEQLKKKFQGAADMSKLLDESGEFVNLDQLSDIYKIRKFKKKDIIFQEDDMPSYFYFLQKGKVKTYKTNELGKEYITGIFVNGNFFGYIALFDQTPFTESAEALEDSEIVLVPKQEFFQLVYNNRELSLKFIKLISNNLAAAEEKLIKLAFNSARKKVAEALLYLHDKYCDQKTDTDIAFPAGREDISAIAGIVPESVSRNLTDFRNEKLIETANGKVRILDLPKLRNLRN